MIFTCPVCGYGMPFAPENNNICSSCGTEFGYDDLNRTHSQITKVWISRGAKWFSSYVTRPARWNPWDQMIRAGLAYELPYIGNVKITVPEQVILVAFNGQLSSAVVESLR